MFLRGQKATFIAKKGLKINFRRDYHISSQVVHCDVRRGKDQIEGERSLCWLFNQKCGFAIRSVKGKGCQGERTVEGGVAWGGTTPL